MRQSLKFSSLICLLGEADVFVKGYIYRHTVAQCYRTCSERSPTVNNVRWLSCFIHSEGSLAMLTIVVAHYRLILCILSKIKNRLFGVFNESYRASARKEEVM